MDELVEFLRARLAEDERAARAATPGPWIAHKYIDYDCDFEATIGTGAGVHEQTNIVGHGYEGGGVQKLDDARFIARHDPARVLREVEAKRRLVDRYAWLREHGDTGGAAWVLPLLAAAYADHPDFRPEWAPEDTGG